MIPTQYKNHSGVRTRTNQNTCCISWILKGTYSRLKFRISHMRKINIQITSTRLLTERPRWNFSLSDTYKKFERGIPQNLKWCVVPDNMQMRQPNLICCIYMNYRACNTVYFLSHVICAPEIQLEDTASRKAVRYCCIWYFISYLMGQAPLSFDGLKSHTAFSRVKKMYLKYH